jgi:hypothetical protein
MEYDHDVNQDDPKFESRDLDDEEAKGSKESDLNAMQDVLRIQSRDQNVLRRHGS